MPDGTQVQLNLPLSAQNVAVLAVLNDPDLIAARAQHGVAQAQLVNAGLLPDPVVSGGFSALISGPADAPAISGSLMQDVAALVTYRVNVKAAKAGLGEVDAGILWQEWQAASRAEQLCITIAGDIKLVQILADDHAVLTELNRGTTNEVAAGSLTIAASSASLAALAATDTALNNAEQTLAQDTAQLDALLGLQPGVDFQVTPPDVAPIAPAAADQAIATLASRRPDLIALRYGYQQADARLRAAILSQFLPVNIGVAGSSDTSKVVSVGPQVSLNLPQFNRNRGGIAIASATRTQLEAQFAANLASAVGEAKALQASIALLQSQNQTAEANANAAAQTAREAQTTFATGNLDALSAVDIEIAAADLQREAIALKTQLLTARLSLATLLGIGLPPLAAPDLVASR